MTVAVPAWDVLTLHPEMVRACLLTSVLGRAVERGTIHIGVHDIRDHTTDRHRTADDAPYGGGAGMVMKVDVVARALDAVRREDSRVLLTSPAGQTLTQAVASAGATWSHTVIVCGHYEGIDARIETLVDGLISLGDVVLTGGEIAAAAYVDACARLVPGVLGNDASAVEESFADDLLEHPHYTRPAAWAGIEVPDILRSGDHGRIAAWRLAQARHRTQRLRPDLWSDHAARHGLDPSAPALDGFDPAPGWTGPEDPERGSG